MQEVELWLAKARKKAEKAAEIWLKIAHLPILQTITDGQMHQLERRFNVKAREGYLDE